MNSSVSSTRRPARRSTIVVLAFACLLAPATATAMTAPAGSNLSARLAELARPGLASLPHPAQAERLALATAGPGSLARDGNRVLVEARFEAGAGADAGALRAAGAEVVAVSPRYRTVTAAVRPADLSAVAAVSGVVAVTEVLAPLVRGADCGGAVRSEGDVQLHAITARSDFGVDGSGVNVGILSDSFDRAPGAATHAGGDVAAGDLPGPGSPCGSTQPVGVADDSVAGDDEGRAMAQIVHDLAPGAALSFATASAGELAFADNIRALAAAGAKVIADDVTYFREPFFQDGPVAAAVNEVAAAGVSYFSAAGNDNVISKGRDIASWEAPQFRDSGSCPPQLAAVPLAGASHCMDFDPGVGVDDTFGITVADGATLTVDLQWAEPWQGVGTDVDSFLLDATGKPLAVLDGSEEFLVAGGDDNVNVTQRPVELLQWENDTGADQEVQLAINRFAGGLPRLKFLLLHRDGGIATEYPQSAGGDVVGPTVFGHAGAAGAIAVGAVPYDSAAEPERYSSRGPVTHYFGPVAGAGAAAAIAPQTLAKPDLAATDCGVTTFFASFIPSEGVWRFCGTSAAAPHAAAVAALVRQAHPGASASQVRADLTATALPVGAFGANQVGAGLIDAYGAVDALALPPTVTITQAPAPLSRERRPTIQFSANRRASFSCAVDGGVAQPCSSPYAVPSALRDGRHGIAVAATDVSGRVGTSPVATFTVDTKAPRTWFAKHPRKLVRTHRRKVREAFRFRSDDPTATFVCKVDRGLARFCRRRITRRFQAGRHTVVVRARDAAGNFDRSPAVFHFRVKRVG